MRYLSLLVALLLVGCGATVYIEQVEHAEEMCYHNGGLDGLIMNEAAVFYIAQCNNGARFRLNKDQGQWDDE